MLAWLLGESAGDVVREALAADAAVVASDLTPIECDRALVRGAAAGRLSETAAADVRSILNGAARLWTLLQIDPEISERARRPFPIEPVRTLDAIHLAAALEARAMLPDLRVLSLDERVRANARALGFGVVPA